MIISEGTLDLKELLDEAKELTKELAKAKGELASQPSITQSINDNLRQIKMHRFDNIVSLAKNMLIIAGAVKTIKETLDKGVAINRQESMNDIMQSSVRNDTAFTQVLREKGLDTILSSQNVLNMAKKAREIGSSVNNGLAILGFNPADLASGNFDGHDLYVNAIKRMQDRLKGIDKIGQANIYNALGGSDIFGMDFATFDMLQNKGDLADAYKKQKEKIDANFAQLDILGSSVQRLSNSFTNLANWAEGVLAVPLTTAVDTLNDAIVSLKDYLQTAHHFWTQKDWGEIKEGLGKAGDIAAYNIDELTNSDGYWLKNGFVGGLQKGLQAGMDLFMIGTGEADRRQAAKGEVGVKSDNWASIGAYIAENEGYSAMPYVDTNGKLTIGYGTQLETLKNYDLKVPSGAIDKATARKLADATINGMIKDLERLHPLGKNIHNLPLNAQKVAIDYMYNRGVYGAVKTKFMDNILKGDFAGAYFELQDAGQTKGRLAKQNELLKPLIPINVYIDGNKVYGATIGALDSGVVSVQ